MADNVAITAGSGTNIAADDVSSVYFQKIKVDIGGDGLSVPLDGGQEAMAASVPVVIASDQSAVAVDLGANNDVTVQGEDAENAAASANPVQVGGRYDATPRTLNDGDVGGIALDADGAVQVSDGGNSLTVDGTVTANAGTGTFTVDNGGTFAVQVDAALPAGTNAIGKLAANDGVNIGDVKILAAKSVVDSNNSTTTPLGISAAFTGTGTDVTNYAAVCVTIHANVDSATDGMTFQFSTDNTNWDDVYTFTFTASEGTARRFQFPITAQYFRVVYTNGGTGQTTFRVQTLLHTSNQLTTVHRLADDTSPDRSAQVVKAAIMAQAAGSGDFVSVASTASGNLKVAVEEFDAALPAGTNAIGKLAANSGVDIGDVDVTSVVPGTGATNLGKAEDAAHSSGDVGVMGLTVRQDSAAALGGTDGDYQPAITDANGRLHVIEPSASGAAASLAIIDDWDETDRCKVNPISGQAGVAAGAGAVGATVQRVTLASDDPAVTALQVIDDWDNAASDGASVSGDVAHDTADAGEPVKIGAKAIAHGANPTAVAANDRTNVYANRHGIPFTIGGHPNSVTLRANYTAAQTNAAIVTVSAGTKIVVTRISATLDNATTVDVAVRVGFATATTPTTTGVVLSHPGIAAGGGITVGDGSGILGIGADNEDLRITSEVPTTGSLDIVVTYFTIES